MNIAIGTILDQLGHAQQLSIRQGRTGPVLERRSWATPSAGVRHIQPPRIPLNLRHTNNVVGQVVHLHLDRGGHLWCVAELPEEEFDPAALPQLYFSAETNSDRRTECDTIITGVGVVDRTAQVGAAPIRFLPGRLDYAEVRNGWQLEPLQRKIVEQAARCQRTRRHGAPITVYDAAANIEQRSDLNRLGSVERPAMLDEQFQATQLRYQGQLEYRPSFILNVR